MNELNNSLALQPIEDQGLATDCWPHVHLSIDRGERSSSQFREKAKSLSRFWFLDRDYYYKSVPHLPNSSRCWVSTDPKHWLKISLRQDRTSVASRRTRSPNWIPSFYKSCLLTVIHQFNHVPVIRKGMM